METFDRLYNVNVRALVSLSKLCVPHLTTTKGNIVNLSTGLALKAMPMAVFYNMGKAAVGHFTRCLAIELGPSGVRVNCVKYLFCKFFCSTVGKHFPSFQPWLYPWNRTYKSSRRCRNLSRKQFECCTYFVIASGYLLTTGRRCIESTYANEGICCTR